MASHSGGKNGRAAWGENAPASQTDTGVCRRPRNFLRRGDTAAPTVALQRSNPRPGEADART